MKRKEKIKKTKFNLSKMFSTILIVLLALACLGASASLFGSRGNGSPGQELPPEDDVPETDKLPANQIYTLDTNISLVQNSHGEAYVTQGADSSTVVNVTSKAVGDYVNIDFSDVSIKEFWESNHTQLKVSFDIVGLTDRALPIMQISPVYSSGAPLLSGGDTKLSPVSNAKFSCETAYKTADSGILGSFDTPGVHTFEYVYTKNVSDNTLSLKICLDGITETFVYSFSDLDFNFVGIKIYLSNNYSDVAAVSVENLNIGYVPALAAFPGEAIVIPTEATVTVLGDKANPIYNIYNHDTDSSLNEDKNSIIISEAIPTNAYAAIYLKDDYKSITVFDYDYITIEYDIGVPEGASPVESMSYLLGRPNGVKQYTQSNTWFLVDGADIYGLNMDKSYMTEPTSSMHVKYVIAGDRLQLFYNDVLYYDAEAVFDTTNNCIEELRVKHFSGAGEITFTNLKVCGYSTN